MGKWDNCNSIINKIYIFKQTAYLRPGWTHFPTPFQIHVTDSNTCSMGGNRDMKHHRSFLNPRLSKIQTINMKVQAWRQRPKSFQVRLLSESPKQSSDHRWTPRILRVSLGRNDSTSSASALLRWWVLSLLLCVHEKEHGFSGRETLFG